MLECLISTYDAKYAHLCPFAGATSVVNNYCLYSHFCCIVSTRAIGCLMQQPLELQEEKLWVISLFYRQTEFG